MSDYPRLDPISMYSAPAPSPEEANKRPSPPRDIGAFNPERIRQLVDAAPTKKLQEDFLNLHTGSGSIKGYAFQLDPKVLEELRGVCGQAVVNNMAHVLLQIADEFNVESTTPQPPGEAPPDQIPGWPPPDPEPKPKRRKKKNANNDA